MLSDGKTQVDERNIWYMTAGLDIFYLEFWYSLDDFRRLPLEGFLVWFDVTDFEKIFSLNPYQSIRFIERFPSTSFTSPAKIYYFLEQGLILIF